MNWNKKFKWIDKFKFASTNQYGDRYKQVNAKRLSVARLTANRNDLSDLQRLILLSHHLDVPVHYDFDTDPQTAYIEVIGAEAV